MDSRDLGEVVAHYERTREEDRLTSGFAELELLRTQHILRRHLPAAPARIIDVGGGAGIHGAWLLEDGYDVHLVDITPRHVELAHQMLGSQGLTAEIGDARNLNLPDASADCVLLLGPLYHLVDREDRMLALREAMRVVRPGGIIVAAAISRFASLIDGLASGSFFDDSYADAVEHDLATGQHENRTDNPEWFTTAYFHRPDELVAEVRDAGVEEVAVFGVESVASWFALGSYWETSAGRARIMQAAEYVEMEPSVVGASPHLLAMGRRAT